MKSHFLPIFRQALRATIKVYLCFLVTLLLLSLFDGRNRILDDLGVNLGVFVFYLVGMVLIGYIRQRKASRK